MQPGFSPEEVPGVSRAEYLSVGTSWAQLLPQAYKRRALLIGAPPTNAIQLSWDGNAGATPGVTLYPGGPPLVLSRRLHGGLLSGPIFAISNAAAQQITVVTEVGGTDT